MTSVSMVAYDLDKVIVGKLVVVNIASIQLNTRTCGVMIACVYNNPQLKSDLMTDAFITRNTKKNDSDYMDWHIGTDKYSVNMHI